MAVKVTVQGRVPTHVMIRVRDIVVTDAVVVGLTDCFIERVIPSL